MTDHAFSPAERSAIYRVIAERRDMRRFVPGSSVSEEVLARLLQAAHAAPSVGLMQPWRFIRITEPALRRDIHAVVDEERLRTAEALGPRSDEFLALKVEGILDCAELFVVALGDGRGAHVFGRRTLAADGPRVGVVRHPEPVAGRSCRRSRYGMGVDLRSAPAGGSCSACPTTPNPSRSCASARSPTSPTGPQLEIDKWAVGRPLSEFVSENSWVTPAPIVGWST